MLISRSGVASVSFSVYNMASLNHHDVRECEQRLVYLITYNRPDLDKIPTAFSEVVEQAWTAVTGVKLKQWVVALEYHSDASSSEAWNSSHLHMVLELEKRTRWTRVRKFLGNSFGIKVNFSSHHTYYSAYKYTTKDDVEAVHSNFHPDLTSAPPPKTEQAIHNGNSSGKRKNPAKQSQKRGLSAYQVAELIQAKKITSQLQLMAFVAAQNREGKKDLSAFICNRGGKVVDECLAVALELSTVEEKYARRQKSHLQLLQEMKDPNCVAGCNGQWLQAAYTLLQKK